MLRSQGLGFPRDSSTRPEFQAHRCKPTQRRYHATDGPKRQKSRTRSSQASNVEVAHATEGRLVFNISSCNVKESSEEIKDLLCSYWSFQNKQHIGAAHKKKSPEGVPRNSSMQKKKKKILQLLRNELKSDRCFCIKEDMSLQEDTQPILARMPLLIRDHVQVFEILNRKLLDPKLATDLIMNLFKSVEKTHALHFLLDEENSHLAGWLAESVWSCINRIIVMKSSSTILNRLASKSNTFHENLSNYCIQNLSKLIVEHNPGKLIQSFLQSDQQFRKVCLNFFKSNLDLCMKNFTALFLLTVAIKHSHSDSEYAFIKDKLVADWKRYLQSKYFKRLIVSYVEYCGQAELVEMHRLLKLSSQFLVYLNDKFRAFILLMFLKREFEDVTEYFCHQIRTNFRKLFKARYFKFLVLKCATINSTAVVSRIFSSLQGIGRDKLKEISQKPNLTNFYSYILLRLCQPSEFPSVVNFLREHFADSLTVEQLNSLADR